MKISKTFVGMFALASAAAALSAPVSAADWKNVTDDRLLNAAKDGNDWLIYGRDYAGSRYSPLDQINASNVGKLKLAWSSTLGSLEGQAVTPQVNNGIMIVTVSSEYIDAYDVKAGTRLWRYEIKMPADVTQFACCGKLAKGVALYEDKVYALTLDARAIALNAKDGTLAWEKTLEDYKGGYTFTMAPTVVKGKILAGFAGGEFGVIGQIVALNAKDGNEVWKHSTIPQPGEEGYDTWGKELGQVRRRRCLADGHLRSRAEPDVLGHGQPGSLELGYASGRQPVLELGHRSRRRYGQAQVVLPAHPERRLGLGLHERKPPR